ncbi:competence protein CoiA [Sporosarcina sp. Marseille-Q4943]|uniref:competence protein CoiA n=1 Tax=Sporosarcina sp. Marseille-Q4943 TaxID=2942204 RepID=UPI00208DCDED|nr:competence protein CoiA family protein [Sporosarcina sp. Marseille-Q4943]
MRAILTAWSDKGRLIILSPELERHELRRWRQTHSFYCPQCKGPVQLKVGEIVIPHFAHRKDTTCRASFSEGESPQHLKGKQLLYQFLVAGPQEVELEPLLDIISQRPDLLVKLGKTKVPIEFQCSTIPISDLEQRTDGYRRAGMEPIWILHTPAKLTNLSEGVGLFQFSKFQEWFIVSTPPEGDVLFTFNPHTKKFHYFSSLLHVAGQRYIGMHRILPLDFQIFPFARPKAPTEEDVRQYGDLYETYRQKELQNRILLNRRGIKDPFLRSCYEMKMLPTQLPSWIGVPVPKSHSFREADVEWQFRFIHFLTRNNIPFSDVSPYSIDRFVNGFVGNSTDQSRACEHFIAFLNNCGIEYADQKTLFRENVILRLISERFLANDGYN